MNRFKKSFAPVLAVCVLLGLAGCNKQDQAEVLLAGIEQRDPAKYMDIVMDAELSYDDGDGAVSYTAYAEWEDMGGIRHLIACRSGVSHDGVDEGLAAEAWSDADTAYVYTDALGWQAHGASDGADAVPAMDLDAVVSYAGRMARTDGAKKAEARTSGDDTSVSWTAPFSDVKKTGGGEASGFKADEADVFAVFDGGGAFKSLSIHAEDGNGGVFDLKMTVMAWNEEHAPLAIPEEISDPAADPEFTVEDPAGDVMAAYANTYSIPDGFDDEILAGMADAVASSGEPFDDVSATAITGGNELQYHTHGNMGTGYWFGVVAIDGYGTAGADHRLEELTAYNDAWYGSRDETASALDGSWDGFAAWSSMHPDEQAYKFEACFLYGDVCVNVQIEAYFATGVTVQDLQEQASYMLRTIGILK